MGKTFLIIDGKKDLDISNYGDCFVYKLSSCNVKSTFKITFLNDAEYLDFISDSEKNDFIKWISKFGNNKTYEKVKKLTNFDIFQFGDLSSMRNEVYDTFNMICNVKFIDKKISLYKPENVELINVPNKFYILFKRYSINDNFIKRIYIRIFTKFINYLKYTKVLLKYLFFIIKLLIIYFLIKKYPKSNLKNKSVKDINLYLSRYPLHFNNQDKEEKYAFLFKKKDVYLLDIVSDGIHQNLDLFSYISSIKKLKRFNYKYILLDKFISIKDILLIFSNFLIISKYYFKIIHNEYFYNGLNISQLIINEQIYSLSKNLRLLTINIKLRNVINEICINKIFYTLFEFPYGKLVSYNFNKNNIDTVGIQHGPVSRRKLYHYLPVSKGHKVDSIYLPKKILCEDNYSKNTYMEGLFQNIHLMDSIPRISYLDILKKNLLKPSGSKFQIIFGGLHDSNEIINELNEYINETDEIIYFKPHPRSNLTSKTLKTIAEKNNIFLTNDHVLKLLPKCKNVITTYSSLALEALILNIDVLIVDIPGLINLSPLSDKNYIINQEITSKIRFLSRKNSKLFVK